ncbi:LysR family transcriptional regulator [Acetobacter sicerae]|uniref:LysR family transcriptional regulator n=1 Tax=Acetobacter sicerae TaxID=85325 RepID=A0ABS8VTM8_9PROT|nr:LysR family transcriptional regulator [Acetobacter sicerae]MCE0743519.1 LysR family transcriptional regulator [Acetobacter sicerae]NHN91790.1 LysR family transcriptional regulator [Acetobacter sicerae]
MALTLRQLRYFASVAEVGSISGAAMVLLVSQSTVTEALRDLEAEMGFRLLDRHARGVVLTRRGQQFFQRVQRILDGVADAQSMKDEDEEALVGTLTLGVTQVVAGYVLPDLLTRFRRAFPKVDVILIEEQSDYLDHMLVSGELDLAVMLRLGSSVPSACGAHVMGVSPHHVWLSHGHPLAQEKQVSLKQLDQEPFITLAADILESRMTAVCEKFAFQPVSYFRSTSIEAIRSLVAAGHGIALLPQLIYRPWSLEGEKIESRPVQEELPTADLLVMWRRGLPLAAPAQYFMDMALQRTDRVAGW